MSARYVSIYNEAQVEGIKQNGRYQGRPRSSINNAKEGECRAQQLSQF
jgi:hypothetical protein